MYEISENGVKLYKFENIENTGVCNHCFSTRIGGVSEGMYESLNLSFKKGDEHDKVFENFNRVCNILDSHVENVVMSSQTHSTSIKHVTKGDRGKGVIKETDINGYDGFVTNEPDIMLVTQHADCVPLFFVDPIKKVIGLSHAGWRGTVDKIAENTVIEMGKYGSRPENILTAIGPSIGLCCFEVHKPVADEFINKLGINVSKYIRSVENTEDKFTIDLWGINKMIMTGAGIKNENISMTDVCTMCNPDIFYSHRVMGSDRGSLAAFLELKKV